MTATQLKELTNAITDGSSLTEIVNILRGYRDRGVTQGEVIEALSSLRAHASSEAEEDRILEVLDFAYGFCAPHMVIWD